VNAISVLNETIVAATAGHRVNIWNAHDMRRVLQRRESRLKYRKMALECFPNQQGCVLNSIEGRVAVEYFDMASDVQKQM